MKKAKKISIIATIIAFIGMIGECLGVIFSVMNLFDTNQDAIFKPTYFFFIGGLFLILVAIVLQRIQIKLEKNASFDKTHEELTSKIK